LQLIATVFMPLVRPSLVYVECVKERGSPYLYPLSPRLQNGHRQCFTYLRLMPNATVSGFAFRVLEIALDFLSFRLISWVIPASYRAVQTSSGTGGR
jgi:hypothetical protein